MMNKRVTLVIIALGLVLLFFSVDSVLAGGGLRGKFSATRCLSEYANERNAYDSLFGAARYRYTYQYAEWNVMSENRLVNGFFVDWNTEGDLKDGGGGGVFKGQFWLVPESASGVWVGKWSMVFKPDGFKVWTGEGIGKGGELEGLAIKIYYKAEPGGGALCAAEASEDFSGKIYRSWR